MDYGGAVSAINAANSFAKGYAQVALMERRQQRVQEQWDREFAFRQAEADFARESVNRQWAMQLEQYHDQEAFRQTQLDTAQTANKLAHVNLRRAEGRERNYRAAMGEAAKVLSTVNPSALDGGFSQYMGGMTRIMSKYPGVELEDTKLLFDVWSKTAMASRAKAGVSKWEADVGKDGHTVLRALGKDGRLVSSLPLNKMAPEVVKLLEDYDKRIETVHSHVMSEANTSARIQSALEGGMLTLASGVEMGDPAKKLEGIHKIAAGLEAEYLARAREERDWLAKSLRTMGIDDKGVEAILTARLGNEAGEAEVVSSEAYTDIFAKTYEEDKEGRPGLTVQAYADMLKEGIMSDASLRGQHKLNALKAVETFENTYVAEAPAVAVVPPKKTSNWGDYEVVQGPEGQYVKKRERPLVRETKNWDYILEQEPGQGGPTGNIIVPEIYHKRLKDFAEGRYE